MAEEGGGGNAISCSDGGKCEKGFAKLTDRC